MTYRTLITALTLSLLACGPALADRQWYRYESDNFVVYSDDSRRAARKAMEHLELFRAALLQVANITVPDDAPKVRLVLIDSAARFQRIVGSQWLYSSSTTIDGIPYLVVSGFTESRNIESSVRHQYAHVVLRYKHFDYPTWFEEGFAVLLTETDFKNRNRTFTIGEYPGRRTHDPNVFDWEGLLDPELQIHTIDFVGDRSDIYLNSWMLVYYFLLDDEFENTAKLDEYFARLGQGQDSVAAMEAVLGEPFAPWARKLRRKYTYQVQKYYAWDLKSPVPDVGKPERVPVPSSEVERVLDRIRDTERHN